MSRRVNLVDVHCLFISFASYHRSIIIAMSFKSLRKAASSLFLSKKSTIIRSGSDDGIEPLLRSSTDTIRPAAISPGHSPSVDMVLPTIHIEDVDSGNASEYQEGEEGLCGVNGQEEHELEEWVRELRHCEQVYPPPKLDDEEYVIERKAGYIQTSRRRLALWNRGWVNLDTWLEDEMKKMDEDPEYQPMGCGL